MSEDMFSIVSPETGVMLVCGTGEEPGTVIMSMGHDQDPEPDATLTLDPASAVTLGRWLLAAARR